VAERVVGCGRSSWGHCEYPTASGEESPQSTPWQSWIAAGRRGCHGLCMRAKETFGNRGRCSFINLLYPRIGKTGYSVLAVRKNQRIGESHSFFFFDSPVPTLLCSRQRARHLPRAFLASLGFQPLRYLRPGTHISLRLFVSDIADFLPVPYTCAHREKGNT
jgi:hypothetical protein